MNKLLMYICAVLMLLTLAHWGWAKPAENGYSTKYDDFDIKAVLASKRLVAKYGDCIMDRGSCTPEGKFLKDILPDAIASKCSKCNEKQKKIAGMMLQHLLLYNRPLFDEITDKYDPKGDIKKMYGIGVQNESKDYENYDEA